MLADNGNTYVEPTVFRCALCGSPIEVITPSGRGNRFCSTAHKSKFYTLMSTVGRGIRHNILTSIAAYGGLHASASLSVLVENCAVEKVSKDTYKLTELGRRLLEHYKMG